MPETKQHSACDECRRRKLKCPREFPTCSRCWDEHITCKYSMRKTMGRPRKSPRGGASNGEAHYLDAADKDGNMIASVQSYEEWGLPPTDDASEIGNSVNVQHQPDSSIPGAEPTLPGCNLGEWSSENGTLATSFSIFDSVTNPSSMRRDLIRQNNGTRQPNSPAGKSAVTQTTIRDKCACLSSMYLAAASMESTRDSGFPIALTALKGGLDTASAILICNQCGKEAVSGTQNIMLLHSLLTTIAIGFDKLMKDIDTEATRATAAWETKMLVAGDVSPASMHMHTGTPDCPARFNIELEPEEWSKLTKRVVRKSIYGRDNQLQTLESLVDATEDRQRAWHSRGFPRMPQDHAMTEEKEWTCLRMTLEVRRVISEMSHYNNR